ncbi:MAG TPA: hypothetical protein DDY37_07100 [Legionella sp.]|nr:hypothetical protein [Legionella sp.]
MFILNDPTSKTQLLPNSAMLSVDLAPYVAAYHRSANDYIAIRNALIHALTEFSGYELWNKMIEHASIGLPLEKANEVLESSIHAVLQEQFVEVIKNSMDEAIKQHYMNGRSLTVEIVLTLDVSDPNHLTATLTDNGPGFHPAFLKATETPENQMRYIDSTEKNKEKRPHLHQAELFGGRGRGLRILFADFLNGDALESRYKKRHHTDRPPSTIQLHNDSITGGAALTLTTVSKALSNTLLQAEQKATNRKFVDRFRSIISDSAPCRASTAETGTRDVYTSKKSPAPLSIRTLSVDTDVSDDGSDEDPYFRP